MFQPPSLSRIILIARNKTKNVLIITGILVLAIAMTYWALRPSNPDFNVFDAGPERKQAFFSYLLPIIQQRNQVILETRQQIKQWKQERNNLGWWDQLQVQNVAEEYRMESFDIESDADWNTLLRRVDIVPPSLALAQAANESAWGASRFAQEGYNYYGQWCFKKGCGMIPDNRADRKRHEVAVFDSTEASVDSYMHNLNSHSAYKPLRDIREKLQATQIPVTGLALTEGLSNYSELGNQYIEELRSMIRFNDLAHYDTL